MSLDYALFDNNLTPDPNDCVAKVQNVRVVDMNEIVRRMTGRGLTLTDTEVQGVFNEFKHLVNELLQDGCAISTPFLKINPSIVGVFTNQDDVFDSSRHSVKLNAHLGNEISINTKKISMHKVKADTSEPDIVSVRDFQSLRENEAITRGATVEIKGSELKINTEDNEQGIFIGNDGHMVKVSTILHNKPSHVIFIVPQDVPGGEVKITIKNKAHKGKQLRQSSSNIYLTVL